MNSEALAHSRHRTGTYRSREGLLFAFFGIRFYKFSVFKFVPGVFLEVHIIHNATRPVGYFVSIVVIVCLVLVLFVYQSSQDSLTNKGEIIHYTSFRACLSLELLYSIVGICFFNFIDSSNTELDLHMSLNYLSSSLLIIY